MAFIAFLTRFFAGALTALQFHAMRFWRHWLTVWVIIVVVLLGVYALVRAPSTPVNTTTLIAQGDSALSVAHELADMGVITSPYPLWLVLRLSGGDSQVRTGTYRFNAPQSLFAITRRLLTADYGLPSVRLTFPEGYTSFDIARDLHKALPGISEQGFLAMAKPYEGYLFPDTYDIAGTADASSVIEILRDNFTTRTTSLQKAMLGTKRSFGDIVIVASLVEKEARTDENRRLVAGVLWNRVDKDMPLQVDAVFGYIYGRDTYSPSQSDLQVDSPYNTYRNKGLPPGPINNPGLAALEAAANPTKTNYFYYLTGNDNLMHYATTYAGHQANLQKYLK